MRHVLVGQTMPPAHAAWARSAFRAPPPTRARVAGALAGTGGVALIGMGPAYAVVTAMYVAAFLLSLGVGGRAAAHAAAERIRSPS